MRNNTLTMAAELRNVVTREITAYGTRMRVDRAMSGMTHFLTAQIWLNWDLILARATIQFEGEARRRVVETDRESFDTSFGRVCSFAGNCGQDVNAIYRAMTANMPALHFNFVGAATIHATWQYRGRNGPATFTLGCVYNIREAAAQ